jgi:P4 family phage/plasmid primase-like protien
MSETRTGSTNPTAVSPIHDTLSLLFKEGDPIIVSSLRQQSEKMEKRAFFSIAEASEYAEALSEDPMGRNTYVTLQQLKPGRTTDRRTDMDAYVRFLVDIDRRNKELNGRRVNASDEDRIALRKVADEANKWVSGILNAHPLVADSGNGFHLCWNLRPNVLEKCIAASHDNHSLYRECLAAVAQRFDNELVKIDTSLSEPEQIIRLWGTWNRRDPETEGRPHRQSAIIANARGTASLAQLGLLALEYRVPVESRKRMKGDAPRLREDFDKEEWEAHYAPIFTFTGIEHNGWEVTDICAATYEGEGTGHRHTGSTLTGFRFDRGQAEFSCFSDDHDQLSFAQVMRKVHQHFPPYQGVIYDWPKEDYSDFAEPADAVPQSDSRTNEQTRQSDYMDVGDLDDIKCTDTGNGKRLARLCGNEIAFCRERGVWFVWNGKIWAEDRGNIEIARKAKAVVKTILLEAFSEPDRDKSDALAKWGIQSQARKHVDAMIAMAKSEGTVAKSISEFDKDEHLFNCGNGVINLISGELLPHDPRYMMTQITRFKYLGPDIDIRDAKEFWKFLCWAQPEQAIRSFLKRAFGYSMWGTSREAALIFLWGDGNNGKGILLNILDVILGDYSTPAEFKTFSAMGKMGGGGGHGGHSDDLAGLHKKRAASVDETNKGGRFNEGLLKTVTGGAKSMRVSRKGEKGFDMVPIFTFWFASNHKPKLTDTGKSMRRRIKLVKFLDSVEIGQEDTGLTDRIVQNEGDILLSWMAQGAVEWYKQGLNTPPVIQEWTGEYFHDEDTLQIWLEECTERGSDFKSKASDSYHSFISFCRENGYFLIDVREFKKRLEEKGFDQKRTNSGGFWHGFKVIQFFFDEEPKISPDVGFLQ